MVVATISIASSCFFTTRALSELPRVHREIVTAEERLAGFSQLESSIGAVTSRLMVLAWGGDDYDTDELIESVTRSERLVEQFDESERPNEIESAGDHIASVRKLIDRVGVTHLESVTVDERQALRQRSRAVRAELQESIERQRESLNAIELTASKERRDALWALFSGHGLMFAVVGLMYAARQWERRLRKESSVRLKQQEAMLAEIPEPLHIVDSSGRVVYWNRGAERLFGYTASETIGRLESALLKIESPQNDDTNVYGLEPNQTDRWIGELHATANDGRLIRIERRRTKIQEEGEVLGDVVLDFDLGERKRQQQVQRRRQRLESLGTLASGIAHDLNNLLTPILMSSRMLQRENTNVDRKALLETISLGAGRGADLIGQLLTFARGGDGQHEILRVEELVSEIVPILKHTLPKSLTLHIDVQPDLPPFMGDATEISQVLMNLAINARDAMANTPTNAKPHNGKYSQDSRQGILQIVIERKQLDQERSYSYVTLSPGQYVSITVTDTGTGITTTVRERMFDPFFTTKERGQGTGLGLSTSLGIVRSHQGAIDVKSSIGEGTSITVLLPALVQDSHTIEEPRVFTFNNAD